MYRKYIEDEKIRLACELDEAKTEEEIAEAVEAIVKMWIALGCPADM